VRHLDLEQAIGFHAAHRIVTVDERLTVAEPPEQEIEYVGAGVGEDAAALGPEHR
jgi:hypothetical protein